MEMPVRLAGGQRKGRKKKGREKALRDRERKKRLENKEREILEKFHASSLNYLYIALFTNGKLKPRSDRPTHNRIYVVTQD